MPSILSGCLILLKIAMAVNDGLNSMLSSIYSIIENVLNNDNLDSVQATDSAPTVQCSKSRILEAFNRRRANLPIFEQTEVYVSNLNPYQEITITNKDADGRRKRSSIVGKSQSKVVSPIYVRSDVETSSPCTENSQPSTPSLVSVTGSESEYQSYKNINASVEQEENNEERCLENELENTNNALEMSITEERMSIEMDTLLNSNFMRVLQNRIQFTNQTLQTALSNVRNPPTGNLYGLTDLSSTSSKESTSAGVDTNASSELSDSKKQFLKETARLYEDYLHNFCHKKKDMSINLTTTPNDSGLKTEAWISNGNSVTNEILRDSSEIKTNLPTCPSTASPTIKDESQHKSNRVPTITIGDYSSDRTHSDCTGFEYFSDPKPISKRLVTKHINTYQLPLSLHKDGWIEMNEIGNLKAEASKKLYRASEILKINNKSKLSIPLEKTGINQSPVDSESTEETSSSEDNELTEDTSSSEDTDNGIDVLKECQPLIKRNLSDYPFHLNELIYSDELDNETIARVGLLRKILQKVGATEVLEDSNVDDKRVFDSPNEFSGIEKSHLAKCPVEDSRAEEIKFSPNETYLMNLENMPFKELDTEEKQITYLNDLTENYRKNMKTMFSEHNIIGNELSGDLERHKVMLDKITNVYKNELDSLTINAGVCQNELNSIGTDSKITFGCSYFKPEASSIQEILGTCVFPQLNLEEIDSFGPHVFIPNKSTAEIFKLVENDESSETLSKSEVTGLLDTVNNSETSFALDCTRNETSTPVKDEKIDDHIWVSINLSSESQKEHGVNEGKDLKSSICDSKLRTNLSLKKDFELAVFDNGRESSYSRQVKEDVSLEAKDWGILAAQMSKNYDEVVSFLNTIDDGESSSVKKESDSENEDCKVKPDLVDTEDVSDIGRGTPFSHMQELIQRDELENVQIYDNIQVCDKEENRIHTDNLSDGYSNLDSGLKTDAILLPNKDKTSCSVESNNNQASEELDTSLEFRSPWCEKKDY